MRDGTFNARPASSSTIIFTCAARAYCISQILSGLPAFLLRLGMIKQRAPEVNLYGYICETEYGMTVAGYYLAVCHPENDGPQLIRCPRMDLEMNAIHAFEMHPPTARYGSWPTC